MSDHSSVLSDQNGDLVGPVCPFKKEKLFVALQTEPDISIQ